MTAFAPASLLLFAGLSFVASSSAAVVWSESFDSASHGSAPYTDYNSAGGNDWDVINKPGATATISAGTGASGAGLHLSDTSGENTTATVRMDHFTAFNTAAGAADTLRISFDWQVSEWSGSAASAFRFGLRDGGTTRFSIGFSRSNVDGAGGSELYFFTDTASGANGSPSASRAIGWSGSTWDAGFNFGDYSSTASDNNTGGFIRFEIVYADQSDFATISLTNGTDSTSFVLTGLTPSSFSNNGGDSFYFSSPGSGLGEAYFDNITAEAYSSIPEPSTVALLAGGLALTGTVVLRRRR